VNPGWGIFKHQISATERELTNLTTAIASAGPLPALRASIQDHEVVLAALHASLPQVHPHDALAQLGVSALRGQVQAELAEYT
jgi:hypothetical protein